jgi:uncharacterized protein (TIGR04255 family)
VTSGDGIPKRHLAEVAFEARFPILFSIPKRVDQFQDKIFDVFDKSNNINIQNVTVQPNQEPMFEMEAGWEFIHKDGDPVIRLFNDKIIIFSRSYVGYDGSDGKCFRNCVSYGLDKFLSLFKLNSFTRMGLRYINAFDVEEISNEWVRKYFKPFYDLERYPIQNTLNFTSAIRIKRDKAYLVVQSALVKKDANLKYVLDLDAYTDGCKAMEYLDTLDGLHDSVNMEFKSLITDEMITRLGI